MNPELTPSQGKPASHHDSSYWHDSHALVREHAVLVKRIACHLLAKLPANIQLDDLVQAGMIGLLEAAKRYDATKGASFETFAGIRIRGCMLDEVRRGDWQPRSVQSNQRKLYGAIQATERLKGRHAKPREVAENLGVSLSEYHRILQETSGKIVAFDELGGSVESECESTGCFSTPHDGAQQDDFKLYLANSIANLPERERLVLSLYYDEELTLKEIGAVLGVSESRVCQIHAQATARLQVRMKDWREDPHDREK